MHPKKSTGKGAATGNSVGSGEFTDTGNQPATAGRRTLKQLNTQKAEIQDRADALKLEIANKQRLLGDHHRRIQEINQEISALTSNAKRPILSEHALLRFVERVKGFDLKDLEKEILSPQIITQIQTCGNGRYPDASGKFTLVVKDNVITTIIV